MCDVTKSCRIYGPSIASNNQFDTCRYKEDGTGLDLPIAVAILAATDRFLKRLCIPGYLLESQTARFLLSEAWAAYAMLAKKLGDEAHFFVGP